MSAQIIHRILPLTVQTNLKVAVVASTAARGSHLRNVLALIDFIAHADQQAAIMAVVSDIAVLVVDLHQITVTTHPTGVGHHAAIGGHDIRTVGVGNVHTAMEGGGPVRPVLDAFPETVDCACSRNNQSSPSG